MPHYSISAVIFLYPLLPLHEYSGFCHTNVLSKYFNFALRLSLVGRPKSWQVCQRNAESSEERRFPVSPLLLH